MYPTESFTDGGEEACILCLHQFSPKKTKQSNNWQKLYKLCCKYLHSSIAKDNQANNCTENAPLCAKCSKSALELSELNDKLESFQKIVSEFVLIFSLGILHRRGKINKISESPKKLIEFEVSTFPEADSWNDCENSDNSSTASSISKDNCIQEMTDSLKDDVFLEEMKAEPAGDDWVEDDDVLCHFGENAIYNEESIKQPLSISSNSPECVERQEKLSNKPKVSRKSESISMKPVVKIRRMPSSALSDRGKSALVSVTSGSSTGNTKLRHSKLVQKALSTSLIPCKLCPKTFTKVENLARHRKVVHNKGIPFKCPECDKQFASKYKMNLHTRTHTGENLFECDFCEYKTPAFFMLKKHKGTHTNIRPFKCDKCPYATREKFQLFKHGLRIHSGEKPFQCDQCDYSTSDNSNLKKHKINIHTTELKFKCGYCGDVFKTKEYVKKHFRRVHLELEYTDEFALNANDYAS